MTRIFSTYLCIDSIMEPTFLVLAASKRFAADIDHIPPTCLSSFLVRMWCRHRKKCEYRFFWWTSIPDDWCRVLSCIPVRIGMESPHSPSCSFRFSRSIVMPILEQFQPEIILVSSGFDACMGHAHPLGGYELTPTCKEKRFGLAVTRLMIF